MPKAARITIPPQRRFVIVEVEGYDGEDGHIYVANYRAESESFGKPDKIYCIAELGSDGVVRFDDWGYATADEARKALRGRKWAQLLQLADS